jgi:hypothetical protein
LEPKAAAKLQKQEQEKVDNALPLTPEEIEEKEELLEQVTFKYTKSIKKST